MIFTRKALKLLNNRLKCIAAARLRDRRYLQNSASVDGASVEVKFSNG